MIYDAIAAGGMATVHIGRLAGPLGFARTVAIKRLLPQFANNPEFVAMFLDEARMAARIQHPNVVPTLDIISTEEELLLVMEYVRGESLSRLLRAIKTKNTKVPSGIVVSVMSQALSGLHAAHDAQDENGASLGLVHRDVSPQNIMVGADGVARVLDFGVAKAGFTVNPSKSGDVKGKVLYMAPEQIADAYIDRRADIYALGIVLFEMLTGERMFIGSEAQQIANAMQGQVRLPSAVSPILGRFDAIVRKATAFNPDDRFPNALAMAQDLESCARAASARDVGDWVKREAGEVLHQRLRRIAEIERLSASDILEVQDIPRNPLSRPTPTAGTPLNSVLGPESGAPPDLPSPSMAPPAEEDIIATQQTRTVAIGAMSLAAIVLLGLGFAVAKRSQEEGAAVEQSQASAARSLEDVAAVPTVARAVAPVAAESAAPAPTAAATVSAPVVGTGRMKAQALPVAAPPPSASTKKGCDQPYEVDPNGHMHFRRECM